MKGISALIATVLLLAFTIAVAGIISIFFTGFTKQTTGAVSGQGQNLIACSSSNPVIDKVYYPLSASGSSVNVTYSNPGLYNVTNITLYTAYPNGTTFSFGGQIYLNPSGTNSSVVVSGAPPAIAPTEVRVVGFCQGNQPVSGSCLTGQSCMLGQ